MANGQSGAGAGAGAGADVGVGQLRYCTRCMWEADQVQEGGQAGPR